MTYLANAGIQTERGPAHQPTANPVSERFNLTLLMKIRTQLVQSGLPLSLWGELAQYCSHQITCVTSKAIDNRIPLNYFQSLIPAHTHPFDHNRLKPFGCLAFSHDLHRSSKVAPLAKRFILVGIEPNTRAWRLWDKHTKRIFITGDAVFWESVFPAAHHPTSPNVSSSFIYPVISDAVAPPTSNSDSLCPPH